MRRSRLWLVIALVLGFGVLSTYLALKNWASSELRDGASLFVLTALGFLWMTLCCWRPLWPGFSLQDDGMERNNPAVVIASCGVISGVALIYAGGNIGDGPSLWNNVFSVGSGTLAFFLLWVLVEARTRISLAIAEDRDLASGIRLGGFLLAEGLVLGRAAAGTWESAAATLIDLLGEGWPAGLFALVAILSEPALQPALTRPFPPWKTHGLYPGAAYVVAAAAYLLWLGKWE